MREKRLSGTPIYYWILDNNEKEALVFLHAAFADHTSFDKQVNYFSDYYKVITLDIIGHGKSVDCDRSDNIDKTSEYIYRILREERIDAIHLIGVSLGSVLAQDFTNKFPIKTLSLTCIGGYDINNFDQKSQKENGANQFFMMVKAMISIKWFAKSNKTISAFTPSAQEDFYNMNLKFKKSSLRYLSGISKMINKFPSNERTYPILIGCGEMDIPSEVSISKKWHDNEPNSSLIIFKNSGHLVNMDVPDEFNKSLHDFLLGKYQSKSW